MKRPWKPRYDHMPSVYVEISERLTKPLLFPIGRLMQKRLHDIGASAVFERQGRGPESLGVSPFSCGRLERGCRGSAARGLMCATGLCRDCRLAPARHFFDSTRWASELEWDVCRGNSCGISAPTKRERFRPDMLTETMEKKYVPLPTLALCPNECDM